MKKPIIKLNSLEKNVVSITTQEDFNELMKIYEVGNWEWAGRTKPTLELYTFSTHYKEKTCITIKDNFCVGKIKEFKNYNIISFQEFCKKQNISAEIINGINEYFEDYIKRNIAKIEIKEVNEYLKVL